MNQILLVLFFSFVLVGCSGAEPVDQQRPGKAPNTTHIQSYEDCVAAGHPIMRSYPPKCSAGDGRIFTKGVAHSVLIDPLARKDSVRKDSADEAKGDTGKQTCKNLCGNGSCEQMVCLAIGCPCAENPENCPADCASRF